MTSLRHLLARLRALFGGANLDHDFAQELESHLEMLTADNVTRGMTPVEARRQAAIRLGAPSSLQVQHRDVRGFRPLADLFQDIKFAARLLVKERWFAAGAIAAIALGIGANTVGFTIVNAAFLRGFPFEQADRLRMISWRPDSGMRTALSVPDLEDFRSQSRSFAGIAAYTWGAINISDDHAAPEQTQGAWMTANAFDVLKQRPVLGRTFAEGDDRRGADPVVIIGYEIWQHRFAGDPNVLGRILRINGQPSTIIGVMPERMKFPENTGSELWLPFIATDAQLRRDRHMLASFGRLADGVSPAAAEAELEGIAQQIKTANAAETKGLAGAQLETFVQRYLGGAARPMLITVMGAVIFVLLIACANVANLLLSRAIYRSREVAVRFAVGATRWRVVRQLLIESIALASIGGVIGLWLASIAVRLFDQSMQASGAPFWLNFTMDYRVPLYVSAMCVGTGILFGLAPALQLSRGGSPHDTLKEGTRGASGGHRANRFGHVLIVGELALTIVLLCGAGLMVRSFLALYATDPGFKVDGLTRMKMQLPPAKYPTADSRRHFRQQLVPMLDAIPGVQAAAITTSVPPLDDEERRFEIDGRSYAENDVRPWVGTVTISPRYFEVLGVAMSRGRALTSTDGTAGADNIVISQVMANRYFANGDPIGRRIRFVRRDGEDGVDQWRTIVGVAAPFLQGSSNEAFRDSIVYLPLEEMAPRTASVLIRSALPPATIMSAVRSAVQSIDADQPVFAIETVAAVLAGERIIYQVFSTLFGVLAAIGLVLSGVGVYGVMAYAVTQRTQEIGVRIAIGARRWDVSWLFLKRGLIQLAVGLAIGLPAALGLASVARFRLVEVEPSDPVTMIGITVIIVSVALLACILPVRKAARIDPVIALRSE